MKYNKPEMEIIRLTIEDVICTSPELNGVGSNINNENVYEDNGDEWN